MRFVFQCKFYELQKLFLPLHVFCVLLAYFLLSEWRNYRVIFRFIVPTATLFIHLFIHLYTSVLIYLFDYFLGAFFQIWFGNACIFNHYSIWLFWRRELICPWSLKLETRYTWRKSKVWMTQTNACGYTKQDSKKAQTSGQSISTWVFLFCALIWCWNCNVRARETAEANRWNRLNYILPLRLVLLS